ncbi:MAG: hypothetical protein K1W02_12725 [Muribaculaceae bacterium]|jgi:hypothetical protein
MIRIIITTFIILLASSKMMAQEEYLILKCLGMSYSKSYNTGFVNKVISCSNVINGDSVTINQKMPIVITPNGPHIYDKGLLDGVFLRKGDEYVIVIRPINCKEIDDIQYNYYTINCVFDNDKSPRFYEILKNTDGNYLGNYQKYIDIDDVLYRVVFISKLKK